MKLLLTYAMLSGAVWSGQGGDVDAAGHGFSTVREPVVAKKPYPTAAFVNGKPAELSRDERRKLEAGIYGARQEGTFYRQLTHTVERRDHADRIRAAKQAETTATARAQSR